MRDDVKTCCHLRSTVRSQGQVQVDEAVSLAKALASASTQVLVFALMPQSHQSAVREVIVKHRRQLEDLTMAFLDAQVYSTDACFRRCALMFV